MPTPDPADVIEILFGNDDKLIEALELQRLNEGSSRNEVREFKSVFGVGLRKVVKTV